MTAYLLVHGTFHTSWCWGELAAELRAAGHEVRAPDLPGRGGEPAGVTLEDWVQCLDREVDAIRATGGPGPVVVAHSQGGAPASMLASRRPADFSALVYLCAIVPADGVSGLDTAAEAGQDSRLLAEGVVTMSADGRSGSINPQLAPGIFYNRCEPAVAAAAVAHLCVEPAAPTLDPVSYAPGLPAVRRAYISATDDHAVPGWLQQRIADRHGIATRLTIEADHCPQLSAPQQLAVQLAGLEQR